MNATKPRFEMGVDAQLLVERMRKVKPGEIITYGEITQVIKRDPQKDRGAIVTARRAIQRTDQIVFECVTNVGYKRISGLEIVESAASATQAIGRTAKRAARKLACAEYEQMDISGKIRFNATASMLGALNQFAKPSSMKLLEKRVEEAAGKLPTAETLRLFSNGAK